MFTLPILPDELRIPLDRYEVDGVAFCDYPGVTAVVRSLGIEEASRWNDAFPANSNVRSEAATALVFQQLINIEGLLVKLPKAEAVPFDLGNPLHKRSVPMDMRSAIYLELRKRASLDDVTEKNSGSPSVSGGTTDGGSTPAVTAQSEPGTS